METPQGDGKPLRFHLQQAEQALGRPVAELVGPPIPAELSYLWAWFRSLSNSREQGRAISFSEIKAWAVLNRYVLEPFELDALRVLDIVFLNSVSRLKAKSTP